MAQNISFEGRTITAVEYSPAEQPLAQQDLETVQPVRPGAVYRAEDIAAAIDGLFATGQFTDIRVEAESSGSGVLVRFLTTPRWFVGGVDVRGKVKAPPNRGQLVTTAGLNLGLPFDESLVKAAEENIERVLRTNGLYEATIRPESERVEGGNQVHFTFHVRSGKRARYAPPVFKGNLKLSENTIIKATGWRYRIIGKWKNVYADRTRNGVVNIQKKYQSQDRLMASVQIESLDYDASSRRVRPTLNIDAGPKVSVQTLEAKVSKGNLRKYVPIYDERRVDRDLLVEGARNLRDYFQTQGYYDVDIDFRERQATPDEIVIEYVIARGQRYKVVQVDVSGHRYFPLDTIRERMFTQPSSLRLRRGRYSEALRKKDEENIENLYRSNGFRDVKVTSVVERDFKGKQGQMAVTFNVTEGPQWFVDKIDVAGINSVDGEILTSRLSSIQGQPFSDYSVASDRNVILTEYFTNGFPDANFQWKSTPSEQPNRVNLLYEVTEGKRQFVRDVLITGLRTTNPELVDRNLRIAKGDPLSPVAMLDSQKNLYDLGIFARVNAAIQNPEGAILHKYVLYDIDEANRYNVSLGFGAELARFGPTSATTLDTPAGSTGFSPRVSFDATRLNFLGRGHVVSLRGRFSTLAKRGSFNYVAPRFRNVDGRNVTFTALYDNNREVRTFASVRQEASVQVSQQFSKPTTGLFRFSYRRVSTSNVVIPTLLVPALLQPVRIGILSANIVQDRRDDPTDTRRGIYNTIDFGLASSAFGSQRSFLRTLGRNATYHRITRNLILARQTTVGLIFPFSIPEGLSREETIPLPERFFGGGSVSHRGFPDNQAGPRDIGTPVSGTAAATQPTGFPLGGNALFFNNIELRFPLLGDNIRGVLFHDAGNIYQNISNISFRQRQPSIREFDYMVHAIGVGVRYKTPVGPVRGDIAYTINPPSFVGFKGTLQELLQCNPNPIPGTPVPTQCQGVQQTTRHLQFFFSIGQTF